MDDELDKALAKIRAQQAGVQQAGVQAPQDGDMDAALAKIRGAPASAPSAHGSAQGFDNRMAPARPEQFDNALTSPRPMAPRQSLGSVLTDLASAETQGASFGYGDEIAAGTMALVNKLFGKPGKFGELLKQAQDDVRMRAERSPALNVTGQITGALTGGGLAGLTTRALMGGAERVAAPAVERTVGNYLMQRGKNLATGAGIGAVTGFGTGEGTALDRLKSAGNGAVWGGAFAGGMDLAGDVAKATGIAPLVKNLLARPTTSESVAGKVAGKLGVASHEEVALQDLLGDFQRSGLSVEDYLKRSAENPSLPLYDLGPAMNTKLGSALAKVDPRGDPLVRRARGIQSIPSKGSAEVSQFIGQRAEQRPGDIKDAAQAALGVGPRQNAVDVETSLTTQRNAAAAKNYGAIRDIVIDDPDVLALFDEPEFRALHQVVRDDARLRRQPEIAAIRENAALPLRGSDGRIRADLSRVSRADLEAESHRLSQLNADEEAYHGAVQDAGYRGDYYELPKTERLGHKGKEDLPDADGMVDPERLLADNKIVKDYNKSLIVRRARAKAVQRIDAELGARQPTVDDSFNFGANADDGFDYYGDRETPPTKREPGAFNTQTLGTLDAMKRMADDIAAGTTSAKAIQRTQARAMSARLQDIRDRLDELHPEYGAARGAYADASHEIEAAQLGGDFWKTPGDQLEVAWRSLSDEAKQHYRTTALAAIEDQLGNGMKPDKLLNEVNARKLRIIAESPEAYKAFEQSLRQSLQGSANDAMIMGGSPTARIAAEQADLGGGASGVSAIMQASSGNLAGLASRVLQNSAVARLRGLGEQRVDLLAPYLTATGEDLTKRLGTARSYRDALASRQRQSALTRLKLAGMLGGQVGKVER